MVFTNEGRKAILETLLKNDSLPTDISLHLFTNDVTPSISDSYAGGELVEMSGNGYTSIVVARNQWTSAVSNDIVTLSMAEQVFTFTAGTPKTVYGYFITINNNGTRVILCADKFTSPLTVQYEGDKIGIEVVLRPVSA